MRNKQTKMTLTSQPKHNNFTPAHFFYLTFAFVVLIWPLYSTETAAHDGNTSANSTPTPKCDHKKRECLQSLKLTDTTTSAWVCVCECKPRMWELVPSSHSLQPSLPLSLKKSVVYILNYVVFITIKTIQTHNQQSTTLPKIIITTFLRCSATEAVS